MGKSKENIYVARKGLWELKICCFSTKNGTAGYERGWDEDREMLLKNLKFFYGKSRSSVALREKGADGREDLWNGILSWISFKFKTVPIIRSQREWIPGKFNGFYLLFEWDSDPASLLEDSFVYYPDSTEYSLDIHWISRISQDNFVHFNRYPIDIQISMI